ncbi:MAG: CvpA family protein [Proteobacteria bacterium]|nr:MAG: CvpA family protein [Pseudomonadota bacterium]
MVLNGLDYVLLAVLAVSAVVGIVRGLVRELLALLSWLVSVWLAFQYAEPVALMLAPYLKSPQIQYVVAMAVIFVVSLLLLSMSAMILVKLLTWAGVAGTDRTLGGLFGLVRGLAVALVIVFVLRLSPATAKPWFEKSILVPYFEPVYEYLDNQDFLQPLQESLPAGIVPGAS